MIRAAELIERKRDGGELGAEELRELVLEYTADRVPDYQMAAFLMAVYFSGMTDREVSALTDSIIRTGETVDLSSIPGPKVDKHSTGGVGDKTSLIAAPLAAAAGVIVPKISGRALGNYNSRKTLDRIRTRALQLMEDGWTISSHKRETLFPEIQTNAIGPDARPLDRGRKYERTK